MNTKEKEQQVKKVTAAAAKAIKELMELCINEEIINPKITMDAETTDGEHYRLIFERIDLDKNKVDDKLFKERCTSCGVDELFTKDDYCNCCGAKQ